MTPAQLATFKAAILAQSAVSAYVAAGNDTMTAAWYNQPSSFIVWRTNVTVAEITAGAIVWIDVAALTVGNARVWEWMRTLPIIDASQANIRTGFSAAFGAGSATVTAALPIIKRAATNAEAVFATGTGTTATPGLLVFEGQVTENMIAQALRP
jgi:hypothetical protein